MTSVTATPPAGRRGLRGNAARGGWSCAVRPSGSGRGRRRDRRRARADGREPLRGGGARPPARLRPAVASRSRPARGPSTIATATAWLSVTIGFGATRSSRRYSARICGQSVSSARAASACTAAIAAWSWYGAEPGRAPALRVISATPSRIDFGIPAPAVLLGKRDELAVRSRARGAPRVGEQHQRQQTRRPRRRRAHARARRGPAGSPRRSARRAGAPGPSSPCSPR